LGQKLGRTVYDMFQRHTAFDMGKLLNGEGSGADESNAGGEPHREAGAQRTRLAVGSSAKLDAVVGPGIPLP
jgi:hypothetical protein